MRETGPVSMYRMLSEISPTVQSKAALRHAAQKHEKQKLLQLRISSQSRVVCPQTCCPKFAFIPPCTTERNRRHSATLNRHIPNDDYLKCLIVKEKLQVN